MPGGDRTGPLGAGPRTGRGLGYCSGSPVPGFMVPGFGRGGCGFGWFRGRGGGRGWRNWFYATGLTGWQRAAMGAGPWGAFGPAAVSAGPGMSRDQELQLLKQQAETLSAALDQVRQRVEELEAEKQKPSS